MQLKMACENLKAPVPVQSHHPICGCWDSQGIANFPGSGNIESLGMIPVKGGLKLLRLRHDTEVCQEWRIMNPVQASSASVLFVIIEAEMGALRFSFCSWNHEEIASFPLDVPEAGAGLSLPVDYIKCLHSTNDNIYTHSPLPLAGRSLTLCTAQDPGNDAGQSSPASL